MGSSFDFTHKEQFMFIVDYVWVWENTNEKSIVFCDSRGKGCFLIARSILDLLPGWHNGAGAMILHPV